MTLSQIRTEIRDLTNTDSTSFTDTDIDRKINIEYKNLVSLILQADGMNEFVKMQYTDLKKASTLSEGDNGYNGEYGLPCDCVIPLRIEVKYDEDQRPMSVYDQSQNEYSEFVENDLKQLSNKVRFARNSYFIRPLPTKDVTKGIYVEYIAIPDELTDDTDTPDFNSLMHDVLTLAVAVRYYLKHPDKYNSLTEKMYKERKQEMIDFFESRMPRKLNVNAKKENFK